MTKRVQVQEAFKLALSMTLFYWFALWMDWSMPQYGALAMVLISLGTTGASLQKGLLRLVGTTGGLAVGMFGIAVFAQDRWGNLLFLSCYLVLISYFLIGSRYGYAWFVAGFLPPLIWASTYMNAESAFHYAIFRYLETSVGIIIYTVVSVLLWPRCAGDQLSAQGDGLWTGLRNLYAMYRRQLATGQPPADATDLRAKLAGTTLQLQSILQAAYSDTPSVLEQKRIWEILRVNVRALIDALEMWRQSIDDCRRLNIDQVFPGLEVGLDMLDRRLERIGNLWHVAQGSNDASVPQDDRGLLEPWRLSKDRSISASLSHFERAALSSFVQQLEVLDVTSRELLRTLRVLARLDASAGFQPESLPADLYQPARWQPGRLLKSVFPAVCFVCAYFFWILVDPPTGASMVSFSATIALMLMLSWMNPFSLVVGLVGAMVVVVAPVYFFVMPALGTGVGLLSLIFVYTFFFTVLGYRSPVLKTMPLLAFVMMTGISNQQSYSFIGLVDGGMMITLGISAVVIVQMLLSPMRPEKILLHGLRRFYNGCARITGAFAHDGQVQPTRSRVLRKRIYESSILAMPQRLQSHIKKLDFKASPDDSPEEIQHLLNALESITVRIQALEVAQVRATRSSLASSAPMTSLGRQLLERVQHVFHRWARFECDEDPNDWAAMQNLSRDAHEHLESISDAESQDQLDDQARMALYAMLGCVGGLIESMTETRSAMNRIDWDRRAEARF